jgi:hypothetical protein
MTDQGQTDLNSLLRGLSPHLVEGVHVFVTLPPGHTPPPGLTPRMVFQETEGVTLILLKSEAEAHDLPCEFPCRMITLKVHSSLAAVGFIARIATQLARVGMGVNPVSGFFHDHLFVPEARADEAMALLCSLAKGA